MAMYSLMTAMIASEGGGRGCNCELVAMARCLYGLEAEKYI
jgi:hypothetical protein